MSKPLPVLKLELQRGEDCGLACIASIIGVRYENVLAEASRVKPTGYPHTAGLYLSDMIRIADRLGLKLRKKRACNLEKDEGILTIAWKKNRFTHHVVVLVKGLIFDLADMTVWEPNEYAKAHRAKFGAILIPE